MCLLHEHQGITMFKKNASFSAAMAVCAVLSSSAFLGACAEPVEDASPGSLSVDWRVLPLGCANAGVESVLLQLSNEAEGTLEQSFDCESSSGTLGEVPVGRYHLEIKGMDVQGHAIFEAPAMGDVLVRAGTAERVARIFELSAAPGKIEAQWRFHDGRVCGAHDIREVRVALFDSFDSFVMESTYSCDEGGGVLAEVPAGSYKIWARAEGGDRAFSGVSLTGVKRGGSSITELVLEPTE